MYPKSKKKLATPPGFEPGIPAPKAGVLPLHYGAIRGQTMEACPLIVMSPPKGVKALPAVAILQVDTRVFTGVHVRPML